MSGPTLEPMGGQHSDNGSAQEESDAMVSMERANDPHKLEAHSPAVEVPTLSKFVLVPVIMSFAGANPDSTASVIRATSAAAPTAEAVVRLWNGDNIIGTESSESGCRVRVVTPKDAKVRVVVDRFNLAMRPHHP